jgi:hypothetical protein
LAVAERYNELGFYHMNNLPLLPSIPLGRYRHYKGGEYEVLGVALFSSFEDQVSQP